MATIDDNTIVWRWDSRPFGETEAMGMIKFNLRFSGQYFDAETNHPYNINRDYNPVTGRYIQSDPIGFKGGINTFAYVNGNPAVSVDFEGLFSDDRKTGRLTSCDGESTFAVIREQDKFRTNSNYVTSNSILSYSFSTELRNFATGCVGMAAGIVLVDLYGDNLGKPDPISFLIKALYIGKNNDYGKQIEIRYNLKNGTIEVWRIK